VTGASGRKIVVEEHPQIPWLSVVLGFGPMLPIVAGALVAWTAGGLVRGEAILLSAIYASLILAFLAGVRRGLSFRTEGGPALAQLATMAGLWLAALLAVACIVHAFAISALTILAISYATLMILDPIAARASQAPLFFARLRPSQMLIAVLALVALLANVWVHG
jgi:Protein of unknown function (DUF3429)